jgi:uncharacterized protein
MADQMDKAFNEVHRRIKKGDLLGLRHSLERGLDPNLRNRFGWSLLMLAALHGRSDAVELLLARGADRHFQNQFGDTAHSLAFSKGHYRLAESLCVMPAKSNEHAEHSARSNAEECARSAESVRVFLCFFAAWISI